jgi:hypothetical protein
MVRNTCKNKCPCAHTNTCVDRAHRLCLSFGSGALWGERHLVFECAALASLQSKYFIDIGSVSGTLHGYVGKSVTSTTDLGFKQPAKSHRPYRGPIAQHAKQ